MKTNKEKRYDNLFDWLKQNKKRKHRYPQNNGTEYIKLLESQVNGEDRITGRRHPLSGQCALHI
jgi:hypothetical protein